MRDIRSIIKRIDGLKKFVPSSLKILIKVEDEEKVIYVNQLEEYLEKYSDAEFIRVVEGNNLQDLDKFLEIYIGGKI